LFETAFSRPFCHPRPRTLGVFSSGCYHSTSHFHPCAPVTSEGFPLFDLSGFTISSYFTPLFQVLPYPFFSFHLRGTPPLVTCCAGPEDGSFSLLFFSFGSLFPPLFPPAFGECVNGSRGKFLCNNSGDFPVPGNLVRFSGLVSPTPDHLPVLSVATCSLMEFFFSLPGFEKHGFLAFLLISDVTVFGFFLVCVTLFPLSVCPLESPR